MNLPVTRSRQPGLPARRTTDPVRHFEEVYDRMDQLVRDFFGQPLAEMPTVARWALPTDIEETDDAFIVELDLPGVRTDDVDIELREKQLRITGEVKERERTGVLRRQARHIGQFEHVVEVPGDVDPDQVEAKLSDGVLTVRLAKTTTEQPRHIRVTGS